MYPKNIHWAENVILVDGDYIDKVAFDLIVNFERMLMRRIPNADLAHWLECIALDSGIRPQDGNEEQQIQVVFVHKNEKLQYFTPSSYQQDIDGKAFKGKIGEFLMTSGEWTDESLKINDFNGYFCDVLTLLAGAEEVKRLMIVPNAEQYMNEIKHRLNGAKSKEITVFAMQPQVGGNFRQEILGYSLMSALGINATEIDKLNQ